MTAASELQAAIEAVDDAMIVGGAARLNAMDTACNSLVAKHGPALLAALKDAERLDYIERTFSGMTNRERYLPVQMIWGKGCNGRTLREASDKYMKRDAALASSGGAGGATVPAHLGGYGDMAAVIPKG